jgi:2'-5' RNA ligase
MEKIRTFIAIDLTQEIKGKIDEFIKEIRPLSPHIKWVSVENIHLTIKFLGNIYAKEHDKLYRGLEMAIEDMNKIKLVVRGTGVFPNPRNARVFWLGVQGEVEKLQEMQNRVEYELEKQGFPREEKPFSPHITIARFKSRINPEKLTNIIADSQNLHFGEMDVSSVMVYRSDLFPSGPEYSLLKEIKFGRI